MADFISRLVGRTLGTAPLVRPQIAPTFSPAESTEDFASPLQAREKPTWPEPPNQTRPPPGTESAIREAPEGEREDTVTRRREAVPTSQRPLSEDESFDATLSDNEPAEEPHVVETTTDPAARVVRSHPPRDLAPSEPVNGRDLATFRDATSEEVPDNPGGSGPPESSAVTGGEEHARPVAGSPRRARETGRDQTDSRDFNLPGPRAILGADEHERVGRADTGAAGRDVLSGSDVVVPDAPHLVGKVVDPGKSEVASPREEQVLPESVAGPGPPLVAPAKVPPRMDATPERVSPRLELAAPEPEASTVKVSIGRIEVRAVMPPAPERREPFARPGPALSLGDYLKQRNGGLR